MIKFDEGKLEMVGSVGKLATELEFILRAFYQMVEKDSDKEKAGEFVDRICANAKKTEEESVMDDLKDLVDLAPGLAPGLAAVLKKLFEED